MCAKSHTALEGAGALCYDSVHNNSRTPAGHHDLAISLGEQGGMAQIAVWTLVIAAAVAAPRERA